MDAIRAMIIIAVVGKIGCQTYKDVHRLLEHLFEDSKYNKNVRPSTNQSRVTQVNISQHISSIEQVIVATGHIVTLNELLVQWYDENLVWDKLDYGGISQISLPSNHYWKPELTLKSGWSNYDMDVSNMISSPAYITNIGAVKMVYEGYFKSKCISDTTFFPFDSHECQFVIACTNHDFTEVILQSSLPNIDKSNYTINNEWTVEKTLSTTTFPVKYSTSFRSSVIANSIFIKRRPTFQILHNYIPIFIMLMLCEVTCFVPVESGERLSFAMTVFLSFVLFSSASIEELPRDSINVSLSSYAMLFGNIATTFGVFWSIFIVCLSTFETEKRKIPKLLFKIALLMKKKIQRKSQYGNNLMDKNDFISSDNENENEMEIDSRRDIEIEPAIVSEETDNSVSWSDVGKVLDILYFFCFLSAMSISTVALMIVLSYKKIK